MPQKQMPTPSKRITRQFIAVSPAIWLLVVALMALNHGHVWKNLPVDYFAESFGGLLITCILMMLGRAFVYFVFEDRSDD